MGIQKQKSCFSCYSSHILGNLNALGTEQERGKTEASVQTAKGCVKLMPTEQARLVEGECWCHRASAEGNPEIEGTK